MRGEIGRHLGAEAQCQRAHRQALALAVDGQLQAAEAEPLQGLVDAEAGGEFDVVAQCGLIGRQVQRETDVHGLAQGQGAGLQLQVVDGDVLAALPVVPDDARIAQLDTADGQRRQHRRAGVGCRRGLFAGGFGGRRWLAGEVVPVAAPVRLARQVEAQAVQQHGLHFHLPFQQRQQLDLDVHGIDTGHGLVAKARRVAKHRVAQGDAQPGEHGQAEVAVDAQLAAGGVVHRAGDVILVVIGVDEQQNADQGEDDEQNRGTQGIKGDLEESGHGCTSVLDRSGKRNPSIG